MENHVTITIRLRPDQLQVVKSLYPELSISIIARVLFDSFLENPYGEEVQDQIYSESFRTISAIKQNQFRKDKSLELRKQLLGSIRSNGISL